MKQLFTLLFIFVSTFSFAQEKTTVTLGLFRWKEVVLMQPANSDGSDELSNGTTSPKVSSIVGQKFRILSFDATAKIVVLQVLDYTTKKLFSSDQVAKEPFYKYNFKGIRTDYEALDKSKRQSRDYEDEQRYFKVTFSEIEDYAEPAARVPLGLALGVINFPFKFRPLNSPTDFGGAFNFGAGIGVTFRHSLHSKWRHSLITGYSISSVVLDSTNVRRNDQSLKNTNNFTAFSFSVGYLIEYERVQAGVFVGSDMLNRINQHHFGWHYQGMPWLSVGFGFAIFSKEDADAAKKVDSQ